MMLVPMLSPIQRTKELSSCGSIWLHVKTKKSHSSEQRLSKTFGEFRLGQETFQNVQLLCASTDDDNSFPPPLFPLVVSVFCSQSELHALFLLFSVFCLRVIYWCTLMFFYQSTRPVCAVNLYSLYLKVERMRSPRTEILQRTSQSTACTCCYFEKQIIMKGESRKQLERDITTLAFKESCNKPLLEKDFLSALLSITDMHCL